MIHQTVTNVNAISFRAPQKSMAAPLQICPEFPVDRDGNNMRFPGAGV
jgi:hypothetical protein